MLFYFACEAAGASSARHSLRPLNFRRLHTIQTSSASRGGIAEVWVCFGKMDTHVCELPVPSWREAQPHRWSLSLPLVGSRRAKLALGWREAPGGVDPAWKRPHPSHRSRCSRCATLPTKVGGIRKTSFARLEPTKVGGIRKSGRTCQASKFTGLWVLLSQEGEAKASRDNKQQGRNGAHVAPVMGGAIRGRERPKTALPRLQCAISHCSKTFYGDRRLHTA
jgi:hypothetical protein